MLNQLYKWWIRVPEKSLEQVVGYFRSKKEKIFPYWKSRRVWITVLTVPDTSQTLEWDQRSIVHTDGVKVPTAIWSILGSSIYFLLSSLLSSSVLYTYKHGQRTRGSGCPVVFLPVYRGRVSHPTWCPLLGLSKPLGLTNIARRSYRFPCIEEIEGFNIRLNRKQCPLCDGDIGIDEELTYQVLCPVSHGASVLYLFECIF